MIRNAALVKNLSICAVLITAVSVLRADPPKTSALPTKSVPIPSPAPAPAPKTVSDILDREIGSGHVLKMTFKPEGANPAEVLLATIQGCTGPRFFFSRVHFRAYNLYPEGAPPPDGFMGDAAPADALIEMGIVTGSPLSTYPYPDDAAVKLLETNPSLFQARKVFCTFSPAALVMPESIVRLEWLHLPASALPQAIRPPRTGTLPRINPSFAQLWP